MAWYEKRRGTGSYRVCWREGEERKQRSAPDLRTSKELVREIERQLALRGYVEFAAPQACPGLAACVEDWLTARSARLRKRTIGCYTDALVLFLRYLAGKDDPADVTLRYVEATSALRFYSWLVDTGRTRTTAYKRASAVLLWWTWASRDSRYHTWLPVPPEQLDIRRDPSPLPRAPSWAEADRCLLACEGWLRDFVYVARFTGLRRSEILMLEWRDVDFGSKTLRVRPEIVKGGYGARVVPISSHLVAELGRWGLRQGPLVRAPAGERAAAQADGRGHVDRDLRRAWTRAGVDKDRWSGQPSHSFRKTIETELRSAGVSLDVVEVLVGHKVAGMGAQAYIDPRTWERELREAVDLIPGVLTASLLAPPAPPKAVSGS
jgi:integrase